MGRRKSVNAVFCLINPNISASDVNFPAPNHHLVGIFLQVCFTPGLMLMWPCWFVRDILLSAFSGGVKWGSEDPHCPCALCVSVRESGCPWAWVIGPQALCWALEYTLPVIVAEPSGSGIRRNTAWANELTRMQKNLEDLWKFREQQEYGDHRGRKTT